MKRVKRKKVGIIVCPHYVKECQKENGVYIYTICEDKNKIYDLCLCDCCNMNLAGEIAKQQALETFMPKLKSKNKRRKN
jgi:hypothetical protein